MVGVLFRVFVWFLSLFMFIYLLLLFVCFFFVWFCIVIFVYVCFFVGLIKNIYTFFSFR